MKLKVKRLTETAKLPTRAHADDSGWDIYADKIVPGYNHQIIIKTGIAVQPPHGYYVEVLPRSSVYKKAIQLANSVAVIDEPYTGEIMLVFNKIPTSSGFCDGGGYISYDRNAYVTVGEKIAQMILRKRYDIEIEEVKELDETERGSSGFGSSGK